MKKIYSLFCLSLFVLVINANPSSLDHSKWDALLKKNVSSNGNVNYDGFKSSESELDSYLTLLKENAPSSDWSKEETMAYWINAYNAFTIKLILNHYPTSSIMTINDGKAWDLVFIEIGGEEYSLNNIEHDILRAKYKDPRIHFAVNCASVSCPRLRNGAFTAAGLNNQMEEMSVSFINNSSKNSLSYDHVVVSQLFNWYKGDFTMNGSIIDFLNKYSKTKISSNASIQFKDYNWNLNK